MELTAKDLSKIKLNIPNRLQGELSDQEIGLLAEDEIDLNSAIARCFEILAVKTEEGLVKNYGRGEVSLGKTTLLEYAQYHRTLSAFDQANANNGCSFAVVARSDGE